MTPHDVPPAGSVCPLNGIWDFAFFDGGDAGDPARVNFTERIPVPAAFDALPGRAGKRGSAVYRRELEIPSGRTARLEFGAVSMRCEVFMDGVLLREHACGYAPFHVDVPPSERSIRTLTVMADNRFDFDRAPMHEAYFDFYQYGGIIRDVALRILPEADFFLDAVEVIPTAEYADGGVALTLRLGGTPPSQVMFVVEFDGAGEQRLAGVVENGAVSMGLRVPDPKVWSPASPHLHRVSVALLDGGREVNRLSARFGLRRIEARAGALWLNGEKLVLKGFNRHEWHPNSGPSTSWLQMAVDIRLMRDLGCNFVRGAHYPQDQKFLDLCDELGLLVWEENLGWGQRAPVFASEKFRLQHRESLEAMVRASINHPSVIIWGFFNEAGSNEDYVRPVFEETVAAVRALDPSRLITFATMYVLEDRHLDLVDLISMNIYPGWYGAEGVDNPLGLIAPFMQKCFASIDARGFGDKPVIVSEIGAEALYGWREPHDDFYTEAYQAAYLAEACREALENPRSSGIAIWHFSDLRTYGGSRAMFRPRTFNNKGVFDEYRRPKESAQAVAKAFARAS